MKFRPLHDRVVVKRIDAEEKTAGGIIIPDSAKEKPSQGEIVAVGEEVTHLHAGQRVAKAQDRGHRGHHGGHEHHRVAPQRARVELAQRVGLSAAPCWRKGAGCACRR